MTTLSFATDVSLTMDGFVHYLPTLNTRREDNGLARSQQLTSLMYLLRPSYCEMIAIFLTPCGVALRCVESPIASFASRIAPCSLS